MWWRKSPLYTSLNSLSEMIILENYLRFEAHIQS